MQIKSPNKQVFEEDLNYTKKLKMVFARETENVRENNGIINNNKTQQQ